MEKDIVVTCPYNSSHRIRKYKLRTHIIKCKKQHDTGEKVTCPLSNSHIIDPEHLKEHIATCSNLSSLVETSNIAEENINVSPTVDIDTHESENWDQGPEVPSYNPMDNSAKKKVLRCVTGLTKSEKKKFRINEQIRIANLKASDATKSIFPPSMNMINEISLRPPHDNLQMLRETEITQHSSSKENAKAHNSSSSARAELAKFSNTSSKALCNKLFPGRESDTNQEDNTSVYNETQYLTSEDHREIRNALMRKILDKSLNFSAMSMKDHSQCVSKEEKYLPIYNQDHKIEINEQGNFVNQTNETFEIFNDSVKRSEYMENMSDTNTSFEPLNIETPELLALLKNNTDLKKEEHKEMKQDDKEDEHEKLDIKWEEMMKQLHERLIDLTGIQNAASEQKALIAKQLNDLELLKKYYTQPPNDNDVLYNTRCAASFTEHMIPQCKTQLHRDTASQEEQIFVKNTSGSYGNACGESNDKLNKSVTYNENNDLLKLKTPDDFCRRCDSLNE